jgi:GTP-binding protein
LQLAILIEMMRREGYELMVGKPEIVTRTMDGKRQEPVEQLIIDVPQEFVGVLMQEIGMRKGVNTKMVSQNTGRGASAEYSILSRG